MGGPWITKPSSSDAAWEFGPTKDFGFTALPSSWSIWATPTKLQGHHRPRCLESSNRGFLFYGAALLLEYLGNTNQAAERGGASAAWNSNQRFRFYGAALLLEYLSNTNQAPEEVVASAAWTSLQPTIPGFTALRSSWHIWATPTKLQGRWRLGCVEGLTQAG